jgi:hypothetical protein
MSKKGKKDVAIDINALKNRKVASETDYDRRKSLGQVTR